MFRWAVICLVISLIAGGLGLTGVSLFAKRLSLILFALFFLGFLALVGFAYLVSSAVYHSELVPALVAVSVSRFAPAGRGKSQARYLPRSCPASFRPSTSLSGKK